MQYHYLLIRAVTLFERGSQFRKYVSAHDSKPRTGRQRLGNTIAPTPNNGSTSIDTIATSRPTNSYRLHEPTSPIRSCMRLTARHAKPTASSSHRTGSAVPKTA